MANQANIPVLILFESRGTKEPSAYGYGIKNIPFFQEKLVRLKKKESPVPQTDTGGLVEDTKGRERTLSKELGKMAP